MTTPLKVGVIGVGALGRHHARLYLQCDNAELVGVYDSNPETAQKVAEEFSSQAYTNADELASDVEALSIAVPTDLHFDIVSHFISKGKHILVEKPLAANTDEGRKLVAAAEDAGLVLQVGHVEQYNPVITYLEKKITSPLFIEAHRLANYPPPRPGLKPRGTEVGVVHDLMIHDIDLILHLVKSDLKQVEAVGMQVLSSSEDIANARLSFENGCVANVTASRISPEVVRKIRVFQPDAYLSLDYGEQKGDIYTKSATGINREDVPIESANALLSELQDFVSCCSAAKSSEELPVPEVSGQRGLKALEVADLVVQKVQKHLKNCKLD